MQVVNRFNKEYLYDTNSKIEGIYDKTWIYDKIEYEIKQFCSSHLVQEVYREIWACSLSSPFIQIISFGQDDNDVTTKANLSFSNDID